VTTAAATSVLLPPAKKAKGNSAVMLKNADNVNTGHYTVAVAIKGHR